MPFKSIIRIVLFIFVVGSISVLVAKEYGFDAFKGEAPLPAPTATVVAPSLRVSEDAGGRLVLFYFHGHRRCFTCRTIEKYMTEAIETFFPAEIAAGEFDWRPLNIEEPQNRHFIEDFGLVSSSAVIAEIKGDVIERSKKLDLVWKLVHDKPAFMEYVRDEVLSFMKGEDGR